jgi:hypothetical protein
MNRYFTDAKALRYARALVEASTAARAQVGVGAAPSRPATAWLNHTVTWAAAGLPKSSRAIASAATAAPSPAA